MPAFVHAALLAHDMASLPRDLLPGLLGVRVRPQDDNPLNLALVDEENPPGITAARAEAEIDRILRKLGSTLRFRRVPLREIALGVWENVLDAAMSRSVIVGLGIDYGILIGRPDDRSAQHVLRVIERRPHGLFLFDDSGESVPSGFAVEFDRVERAALAVSDGLWLLGHSKDLALDFTLPWTSSDE